MANLLPFLKVVPGFALDLTTTTEKGEHLDFTRLRHRKATGKLVDDEEPMFLIGCPPCTEVSSWQALNAAKYGWSAREVAGRRAAARIHIDFVCELYREQLKKNRYFFHEHPEGAVSWEMESIKANMELPGVIRVVRDQCQLGQSDAEGNL